MKLSSMQLVGSTVGSNRRCPTAETILEYWGFDDGSVQTVRFSTNFVFEFRQRGTKRFLRFSPAWERQVEHIQAETELLTRLVEEGFQVAQPLPSKFGNLVETVETELGSFHAVVFTALDGKHAELDELSPSRFRGWGSALGRLHQFCKDHDTSVLARPSYREHLAFIREHISEDENSVCREWETLSAWVESIHRTHDNFGLIHYDFELDNICWGDNGEVQILDFDDCAYHWYAHDIAMTLEDLFEQGDDKSNSMFKCFLEGYHEHCSIDDSSLKHIPMFLRLARLFRYAKIMRSVDQPIEATHGWLRPLQEKLTHFMITYRSSL